MKLYNKQSPWYQAGSSVGDMSAQIVSPLQMSAMLDALHRQLREDIAADKRPAFMNQLDLSRALGIPVSTLAKLMPALIVNKSIATTQSGRMIKYNVKDAIKALQGAKRS